MEIQYGIDSLVVSPLSLNDHYQKRRKEWLKSDKPSARFYHGTLAQQLEMLIVDRLNENNDSSEPYTIAPVVMSNKIIPQEVLFNSDMGFNHDTSIAFPLMSHYDYHVKESDLIITLSRREWDSYTNGREEILPQRVVQELGINPVDIVSLEVVSPGGICIKSTKNLTTGWKISSLTTVDTSSGRTKEVFGIRGTPDGWDSEAASRQVALEYRNNNHLGIEVKVEAYNPSLGKNQAVTMFRGIESAQAHIKVRYVVLKIRTRILTDGQLFSLTITK